jgi:hypothetical protein
VADIKSKSEKALEGIRVMIKRELSKFNGQDQRATIQRCLIILYLANIHPLFKDEGKVYNINYDLLYFSGPKLKKVALDIGKEWGTPIKFDRYRTARSNYEKCKSYGYVYVRKEKGNNRLFALTDEGLKHCEEIVNLANRRASSIDLSKVRVIAIDSHSKITYILALKEDGSYGS